MACSCGMRFTPNLVVGLTLTAAGGALLLDTLDVINARELVRYWPVILVLFGFSIIAQALQSGPAAAPGETARPIITPGLVIMLVIVGLIVSNFVQRRVMPRGESNPLSVHALLGRSVRTSAAVPFRGATVTTVMGRSRLDLSDAVLAPGEEAVIDVFAMMGGLDIRVPDGWDVQVEAVPVMGRADDRRFRPSRPRNAPAAAPDDAAAADGDPERALAPATEPAERPRVIVRGFIMMGNLHIES